MSTYHRVASTSDIIPGKSAESLMIEISGREQKIEAFIELMRPYGIHELARTGRIALVRGQPGQGDLFS